MSTDSFERDIKLSPEAYEKLLKVMNEPIREVKRETNAFESLHKGEDILESIEKSFQEIGEYKQGKRQFKSLKESQSLWDKWAKEVENE